MPWDKRKITEAQGRILNLLADGKQHAIIPELKEMGYSNPYHAIRALEDKGLIELTVEGGYHSRWQLAPQEGR